MAAPPPPPPPGGPPPPPAVKASLPKPDKSRSKLLDSIQKGKKLKKAETNDRSAVDLTRKFSFYFLSFILQ